MRALTEEERQERRDRLAACAAGLFATTGWSQLTIDAVAQAAGVAKGSVFLAFSSKEDLVLHAVGQHFHAWLGRLSLVSLEAKSAGTVAQAVLASLREDPLLLPLLALVGPVLEVGCSAEAVVRFKEGLARDLGRLAVAWGGQRPDVATEVWGPLFLRVYALIVGAWAVGETSDRVRSALADRPDLQALLTTFDALVVPMLEAELRAILPE